MRSRRPPPPRAPRRPRSRSSSRAARLARARSSTSRRLARARRAAGSTSAPPRASRTSARSRRRSGRLQARIETAIPGAACAGATASSSTALAVVAPGSQARPARAVPGVDRSGRASRYHALLPRRRSPGLIGAPAVWGPTLATAGNGMKIAIIDDGLDQTHPFFDPTRLRVSGRASRRATPRYTTPKVIVASAFAPPTPDLEVREHAVRPELLRARDARRGHRRRRPRTRSRRPAGHVSVSGIAPGAYLGNYKVLTMPTTGVRARRQLARDRRGDRGGREGRHGRDQPLARRAGDRADAATSSWRRSTAPPTRASSPSSPPATTSTAGRGSVGSPGTRARRSPSPRRRRRHGPPT